MTIKSRMDKIHELGDKIEEINDQIASLETRKFQAQTQIRDLEEILKNAIEEIAEQAKAGR